MRNPLSLLPAGMALGLLLFVTAVSADEEKVPLYKLPKAVLDAVKARFDGAELLKAEKEVEDEKTLYEVTLKHKGQQIDVTLTSEGRIVEIEKRIAAKDLPKAAAEALEEKYPKATYKKVEEIAKVAKKEEKLAYYEVLLVTADKKVFEVQVTAEGKIVNVEKKDSDKDDD